MDSKDYDEIFKPLMKEIKIGDEDAILFASGKNEHSELTFPEIV